MSLAATVVGASSAHVAWAEGATATAVPMRFDFGANAGFVSFPKDSGLGNAANPNDVPNAGPMFGVHGGTVLMDGKLGLEAQARMAFSTLASSNSSVKIIGWRLHGLWHFATEGAVKPFATVGYGQEVMINSAAQCPAKGTSPANCMFVATPDFDKVFALGAGARMPLSHRLALRAQVLYLGADGRPKGIASEFEGHIGVSYTIGGVPEDADKDGLPDESDKCPTKPEDKDGFADTDGCPDEDNDNDGILDGQDRCPNQAEDLDGFQDGDG